MRSAVRVRPAAWAFAAAITAACAVAAALPGAALAQPPSAAPPTVLDGPSANIVALSGVSVARDGTGGVAYLKDVGGVQHVFVSRLAGSFQPPVRVDTGLSGASSQPVIAAGNGGLLLTAFINGGQLFVVDQASTTSGFTTPSVLASGASNPAIAVTNLSKAYLAFTANDGSGHDVRGAYYYQGNWEVEPGSFNVTPADDAGTGTGRPAVAAAGDGVGIVVWGEGGHIYTRRVWGVPPSGTGPSIAYEQADIPSLDGWNEVSTSDPVIGSGGDSSYVSVAFNEVLANGSQQQSRVLMRRLRGGMYDVLAQPDGLSTPGVEGADDPQACGRRVWRGVRDLLAGSVSRARRDATWDQRRPGRDLAAGQPSEYRGPIRRSGSGRAAFGPDRVAGESVRRQSADPRPLLRWHELRPRAGALVPGDGSDGRRRRAARRR